MTSIKVKLRLSTVVGREGTIYYQIIHGRRVRQLTTMYHVRVEEWNEKRSSISLPASDPERLRVVTAIREGIRGDVDRMTRIAGRLQNCGAEYTVDDLVEAFRTYAVTYSVFNYMSAVIRRLVKNGKVRTSETYRAALASFRRFRNGADIMLDGLDSDMMEDYEAWLQKRGVRPNTTSFYARILRAVYNRAVDEGAIEDRRPFRRVYTGVDKTVKRALTLKTVRRIKALDLSLSPELDYARDMFMMSFMLRGMSFIDMSFLRKKDLRNGHIFYRRRKTGQLLSVEWTREMQMILDKYPGNDSDYLLPIIRCNGQCERNVYRNMAGRINSNLKCVARLAGVEIPLTLYVARHSWASVARNKGIPVSVISEGMGHDSETTTRIYLASLDTSVVDKANSLIIASL